jgi:DNA-binding NtrC family response regulator
MSEKIEKSDARKSPAIIKYQDSGPPTLHLKKCKLTVEDEDRRVYEFIFDQDVIAIGSQDDNDLVIPDPTISKYHARIIQEPEGYIYILQDMNSTNGSFINRVKVREAYLRHGCAIHFGKVQVKFHTLDEKVEITPSFRDTFGDIVGKSIKMREIFGILEKISPTGATVIIEGETGTGKEVIARTLHEKSLRAKEPFIVFDCGAVPKDLIESELFGHEKGSFTGAIMTRQGLFEMAQNGTLFLDEIGELSLELQPKLLRALEHREIRRVGSNKPIKVDVRLIAATNKNLDEEVKKGRFREDLFYRLSVVHIHLPPLRERKEDIPLLIKHFLRVGQFNQGSEGEPRIKGIHEEALGSIMEYDWPGNIRELLNVIERACSFAEGEFRQVEDISSHITGLRSGMMKTEARDREPQTMPLRMGTLKYRKNFKDAKEELVKKFEREYLEIILKKNNFNISNAAKEAQIDRKYLRKLITKYEIRTPRDLINREKEENGI